MANVRIKDLGTGTIADTDSLVVDRVAGTVRATVADLRAVLGATGPGFALERVAGVDDFDHLAAHAWLLAKTAGGSASVAATAAPYGMPSHGAIVLTVDTTGGASVQLYRVGSGLQLDAAGPLVFEAVCNPSLNGGDDEYEWAIGLSDESGDNVVALYGVWSGGARVHALAVFNAGVATTLPVTLPAISGGYAWRIRLSVSTTGVTLFAALDGDELAEIDTLAQAPTAACYMPFLQAKKEAGAGGRALVVDAVAWSGLRATDNPGAGFSMIDVPEYLSGPVDHGTLTGLGDDDHTIYLKADGSRNLTGNLLVLGGVTIDGRDLSVDGAKLDGIASNAAAVGSGVVEIGLATSDGGAAVAARADHTHDGGFVYAIRKTASFTLANNYNVVLVDTSGGAVTVTLPAQVTERVWLIKKITTDVNKITLDPDGVDNVEGANANFDLPGSDSGVRGAWTLVSSSQASASGWWVL